MWFSVSSCLDLLWHTDGSAPWCTIRSPSQESESVGRIKSRCKSVQHWERMDKIKFVEACFESSQFCSGSPQGGAAPWVAAWATVAET